MEHREFEVVLHSANNLPNVRKNGRMKVYAKVSISGLPDSKQKTSVDEVSETNPCWNCRFKYLIPMEAIQKEGTLVKIKLKCDRMWGDRYVGEVNLYLNGLFRSGFTGENLKYFVYRNDAEGTFGTINLSYSFGENYAIVVKDSNWGRSLAATGFIVRVGVTVANVLSWFY